MKKKEILFIAGVLVFALILWAVTAYFRRGTCNFIRITVNGEEYGTYSLAEDREISVNGNVCEIRDGRAKNDKSRLSGSSVHAPVRHRGSGRDYRLPA